MTGRPGGEDGRAATPGGTGSAGAGPAEGRPAAQLLADRVAAALVRHEPGWRLPRRSALARRHGVSPAEMAAAIEELSARRLVRRLPDGQVYRASPADYLIRLEGLPELRASIDPMGMGIDRASRHVSWRRAPEDIGGALGLSPGDPVCVVRCLWTAEGSPAACSATYLSERHSFLAGDPPTPAGVPGTSQVLPGPPACPPAGEAAPGTMPVPRMAGLHVELQPPASSVARSLRLAAGQPAVQVTVRFDDASAGVPIALATAVLRAEMFRVVIESANGPRAAAAADDGGRPRAAGDRPPSAPAAGDGGRPRAAGNGQR